MNSNILQSLKKPWQIAAIAGAIAVVSGTTIYTISQHPTAPIPEVVERNPATLRVAALGRIEPEADVIQLVSPIDLEGDRILDLLVEEGAKVKAGDVIAILDSRDRLQDELNQAQAKVKIAEAKLAQVKAGAKSGEIAAQKSQVERLQAQLKGDLVAQNEAIAQLKAQWEGDRQAQAATLQRLRAELNFAQSEYQRYRQLQVAGAISQSSLDDKRLSLNTAQQQLNEAIAVSNRINTTAEKQISESRVVLQRTQQTGNSQIEEAKATFDRIAEVRPVDIQTAQAELTDAIASRKLAETTLEKSYVRSPITGRVLQINARKGEKPSDSGIVELARTEDAIVVAEVYQTDIAKVKVGQVAKITSQGFSGELQGKVYFIGQQVIQQSVYSNQPGENLDRRVVKVKIRLNPEASQKVAGSIYLQVQTVIDTDSKVAASHLP